MKKKIGLVDLFIDEWHSNHLPGWIAEAVRKDEFELAYAWEEKPHPGRIRSPTFAVIATMAQLRSMLGSASVQRVSHRAPPLVR